MLPPKTQTVQRLNTLPQNNISENGVNPVSKARLEFHPQNEVELSSNDHAHLKTHFIIFCALSAMIYLNSMAFCGQSSWQQKQVMHSSELTTGYPSIIRAPLGQCSIQVSQRLHNSLSILGLTAVIELIVVIRGELALGSLPLPGFPPDEALHPLVFYF